jgi:glycosyltransferase involved in cell wall biosynthesis
MSALNAEASISMAIRSIVKQTFEDWELLVYDDGSRDRTADAVSCFDDPRIRFRRGSCRIGLAARLNQGIRESQGDLIARMDADDVAYPERLTRQLEFLRTHPEIDLVGSSAIVFSRSRQAIGMFRVATEHAEICRRPAIGFVLPHPTWLARRTWFERFSYREDAKRAQDQDLLLRAHTSSRFANLPEVLLGYHQDTPSLRHIVLGRWHYGLALYRDARERGTPIAGLVGMGTQLLRAVIPATLIAVGRGDFVLRRRFQPVSSGELERWTVVLADVSRGQRGIIQPDCN